MARVGGSAFGDLLGKKFVDGFKASLVSLDLVETRINAVDESVQLDIQRRQLSLELGQLSLELGIIGLPLRIDALRWGFSIAQVEGCGRGAKLGQVPNSYAKAPNSSGMGTSSSRAAMPRRVSDANLALSDTRTRRLNSQ